MRKWKGRQQVSKEPDETTRNLLVRPCNDDSRRLRRRILLGFLLPDEQGYRATLEHPPPVLGHRYDPGYQRHRFLVVASSRLLGRSAHHRLASEAIPRPPSGYERGHGRSEENQPVRIRKAPPVLRLRPGAAPLRRVHRPRSGSCRGYRRYVHVGWRPPEVLREGIPRTGRRGNRRDIGGGLRRTPVRLRRSGLGCGKQSKPRPVPDVETEEGDRLYHRHRIFPGCRAAAEEPVWRRKRHPALRWL